GYQQPVNLIATFKTKDGAIIQGTPAKMVLPGKPSEPEQAAAWNQSGDGLTAQTISFQKSTTPTNNRVTLPTFSPHRREVVETPKSKMRTTTIEVPSGTSLAKRPKQRLTLELGADATRPASLVEANSQQE